MTKYRVTMNDGSVIEVEADSVELATEDRERSVALDAAAYDAVDIEAASLALHSQGDNR